MARLGLLAERAARAAARWLERLAMNPTQAALERVTRVPGVRGALVASATDGLVVAEQLMDGIDGRAAAALAGSLVARLGRATAGAGRRPPASSTCGARPAPCSRPRAG